MFELFQPTHLLFTLLVALVVFGPLEMSRKLGQTLQSSQEVKEEIKDKLSNATSEDKPLGKRPIKIG
jgi:Sec-independent protein translocase protein TatA